MPDVVLAAKADRDQVHRVYNALQAELGRAHVRADMVLARLRNSLARRGKKSQTGLALVVAR